MHAYGHSVYRVPARRPFLLRELRNKLPGVDDQMIWCSGTSALIFQDVISGGNRIGMKARMPENPAARPGCEPRRSGCPHGYPSGPWPMYRTAVSTQKTRALQGAEATPVAADP